MSPPAEKRRRLSASAAPPSSQPPPLPPHAHPHHPHAHGPITTTTNTLAHSRQPLHPPPRTLSYAGGPPVGAGRRSSLAARGRDGLSPLSSAGSSGTAGGSTSAGPGPHGENHRALASPGASSGGITFTQPFAAFAAQSSSETSSHGPGHGASGGDGAGGRDSRKRPRLTSQHSADTALSSGGLGDELRIDGYRDVQIVSNHYDDIVACRAISTARGDQRVALKLSLSARASAAAQFKAEAALLAKLRDAGVSNITKAMMVVANEDLHIWSETYHLRDRPPAPYWYGTSALLHAIDNAIKLVRLVASIHKVGIVHGSIRPTTISNSVFGEVHLHDFSCAFALVGAATEGESAPIRERGMNEESLPYLAPECSGRMGKTADYRSDYYSIGASLFEIFTGQVPFADALDPLEIVHAHIAKRPPLMSTVDASVPHPLSLIVAKLLDKSPDSRYQTSQGLVVDLERVRELISATPPPSTSAQRASSSSGGTGSSASAGPPSPASTTTTHLGNLGAEFVPGSIDEAAYFRLPPASKLFGRDDDMLALKESFEHVKNANQPAVVVVKGGSGIGKTTLIETLRTPAGQSRGHFTSVKFDQIKSPVPFFAITQALSGLFRQLLSEPEAQLAVWRRRLSRALGKEGRVLADMLPSLEQVFEPGWLDEQPPVPQLAPQESTERFQQLVQRVLKAFARSGKPLVVVFDDLQWSTTADLAFIRSLALLTDEREDDPTASQSVAPMLLLCVWRDNEVGPDHIVETDLVAKLPHIYLTLSLEPLTVSSVSAFIREALRNPTSTGSADALNAGERIDADVKRLSQLVLEKTGGSPLFVAQLLKAFNAEGLFTFDFERGQWLYDLDIIASKTVSTNVVELLLAQMVKYTARTQEALKVAACLGNEELDAVTLAKAAGRSLEEISRDVQDAVQEGLLIPFGRITIDPEQRAEEEQQLLAGPDGAAVAARRASFPSVRNEHVMRPRLESRKASIVQKPPVPARYAFFHDRSQQAAYALIPVSDRRNLHYTIGQRLVAQSRENELHDSIFQLVQQLNYGIDIVTTTEDRDRLAHYNLLAGQKANQSTAFEAARSYLQIAWDLLGPGGKVAQHELWCKVVELLIEVEYSLTDYAAAQEFVRVYLEHAKDQVAKLRVYSRSIRCAAAVGDSVRAIEIGRSALAMVGLVFPSTTEAADALVEDTRERLALSLDAIKSLEDAPRMTDPIAAGAQAILAALVPPVYFVRIDLLGALSSLSLDLSVRHGSSDAGAFVFTLHAVLVRAKYNEAEESLAYGKAAIAFFEKNGGSPLACPTYKVYSSHVAVWAMPVRDVLPTFHRAVSFGIEYRDAEYVGFGCGELCSYSLLAGLPISEIGSNVERYAVLVRKFRNELSSTYIGVIQQATYCLLGRSQEPCELDGEAFSLDDYHTCSEKGYSLTILQFHMFRLMISVFFNDRERAKDSMRLGRENLGGGQGLVYPVFFQLFEAVVLYDSFELLAPSEHDILAKTHKLVNELAASQPANFRPLRLWLDAERQRVSGPCIDALPAYDAAIAAAASSQAIHLAACLNERAAACISAPKLAAGYLIEAHAHWLAWGCLPKAHRMEVEHPHLFPSRSSISMQRAAPTPTPPLAATIPGASDYMQAPPLSADSGDQTSSSSAGKPEEARSLHGWTNESAHQHARRPPSAGSHESLTHSHSEQRDVDMVSQSRSVDHSDIHQRSHLATELDLRTVVSASSVISSELSIDGVVSKLLNLALRTAGAEMCMLVLDKGGTLCAEAIARSDNSEVQHLRRTDSIDTQPERYPCSVVNYVARSKTVITSLEAFGQALPDPYLKHRNPKSILCIALVSQQRTIGVLWMENSQTSNAFTPDRLEILSLISGQAASTIEKARLVQDLKKSNEDLKRSQSALEASNRNLEGRIAERTLELRHNNTLLQAEVAEKERAQAEMRSAKEIAESATAMKSQFLANMSHEIRTPFNAVVALSSLLLDTQLTPVQTDYVETIKNSSQELLVVINDILDYSKIELDHLELSAERTEIRAVLESSMDMVAERAATKNVELALVIEEGDIFVEGDVARLRQIVVNLLSNAVKFTSNGEITVTASSTPYEADEKGRRRRKCKISVKDTGIGIAKENFNRLFRVFSQAEGAETSRNFGGTGLGLAISKKLALLMDGDLVVDSELGRGSTFTVEWIAIALDPPAKDPYAPAANRDLAGRRVLVVDANETSRTVVVQLLKSFGLVAEGPADVNSAYGIAIKAAEQRKPYDLIIVDAFLPSFGAQILLRRLRQKGLDSPAIALTRMGSPIYEEMRQLDCKFLIKPIKRNRLHHTIRLVFPAGESPRVASPAPASPVFPGNLATRNPLAILVAEDNPINVKVITHLLKRMGYTCDVAEDGLYAVEKAQKKRYDLILMDLNMPRMDGLTATRKIHELMPDADQSGYVSKPILVPELVNALNAAGTRRAAQYGPIPVPPVPSSGSGLPFELELPTSRLGRANRKNSSVSSRSTSSTGKRSGPPSPSPEPGANGSGANGGAAGGAELKVPQTAMAASAGPPILGAAIAAAVRARVGRSTSSEEPSVSPSPDIEQS
ncbi:hypothetical protein Rhopal_001352-T1 [Rhodotorula paludigena]|uniref:histidine kinase n=1 Tax=Rhodotorula paludigena TaxID=86838 RepID=A0AAV5G761_9BASI|nr:hypothetical protein Rhopal_001352-T1 [Rhodotorula paludigena]